MGQELKIIVSVDAAAVREAVAAIIDAAQQSIMAAVMANAQIVGGGSVGATAPDSADERSAAPAERSDVDPPIPIETEEVPGTSGRYRRPTQAAVQALAKDPLAGIDVDVPRKTAPKTVPPTIEPSVREGTSIPVPESTDGPKQRGMIPEGWVSIVSLGGELGKSPGTLKAFARREGFDLQKFAGAAGRPGWYCDAADANSIRLRYKR